jgi:hypothetical protein
MRAIECPCGHHFEVDRDHPEMTHTDEQMRARIATDAYDVVALA